MTSQSHPEIIVMANRVIVTPQLGCDSVAKELVIMHTIYAF